MYINEAFDFNQIKISKKEIINKGLTQISNTFNDTLITLISDKIIEILKTKVYPDLIFFENHDIVIEDKDIVNKSFIIDASCVQSWYKITIIDGKTIEIVTDLDIILFDPFILYLASSKEFIISKISCAGHRMTTSSFTIYEYNESFSNAAVFDFLGYNFYLLRKKSDKYKTVFHVTEELISGLETINIEINKECKQHVILRNGWYFETPDIYERFKNWLATYKISIYYRCSETEKEHLFLKRVYRDANHPYKDEGGYFIKGKVWPKRQRVKPLPRAKDLIIEAFDFNNIKIDKKELLKKQFKNLSWIALEPFMDLIIDKYKSTSGNDEFFRKHITTGNKIHLEYIKDIENKKIIIKQGFNSKCMYTLLTIEILDIQKSSIALNYEKANIDNMIYITGIDFIKSWNNPITVNVYIPRKNTSIAIGRYGFESITNITTGDYKIYCNLIENINIYNTFYNTKGEKITNPNIGIGYIRLMTIDELCYIFDSLYKITDNVKFYSNSHISINKHLVSFKSMQMSGKDNYYYKYYHQIYLKGK